MLRDELIVSADEAGVRIDRYLTSVLGGQSRSQVQRLIKDGKVTIAGQAVPANRVVRAGETIAVEVPAPVSPTPQPEDHDLDIVYQDSDLVVVNKPAGMVVHPAAGHAQGTLVNALLHEVDDLSGIGGELRPGIVHRLDRGTSGLMVVAKNDRAHTELARQFHDREVEKEYVALVWGVVQAGKRIDLPIGRDPGDRKKMSARARRARSAATRDHRRAAHAGRHADHVAIATGRTHQIRVHSERDRPSDRRRRRVRRPPPARGQAICGPCSRWTGRSCTPAVSCFIIRPTDVRWSSRRRCLTICNRARSDPA